MDRPRASWLSGPEPAGSPRASGYPGERLGLPPQGSRALARMGRRLGALLLDWLIGYGLAALGVATGLLSTAMLSTAVLLIWFVLGVVAVRLFGFTPGQWALGLAVVRLADGEVWHVGLGRAAARGLLIALVIPPLFTDGDGRGLHDRITGTAVVRR
ncbi:MAG: RDD family protein [Mycobacteriaceae bacterium]|nr:RDD family protein [Mycobacteriaceae bacterium]